MDEEQKQQLAGLAFDCARAVLEGRDTITVSKNGPKRVPGFPRGELLSVGTNGAHNYAVCPVKVLAGIHSGTKGGRMVDGFDRPCGAICAGKVRDGMECAPGRCAVRKTPNEKVEPHLAA